MNPVLVAQLLDEKRLAKKSLPNRIYRQALDLMSSRRTPKRFRSHLATIAAGVLHLLPLHSLRVVQVVWFGESRGFWDDVRAMANSHSAETQSDEGYLSRPVFWLDRDAWHLGGLVWSWNCSPSQFVPAFQRSIAKRGQAIRRQIK